MAPRRLTGGMRCLRVGPFGRPDLIARTSLGLVLVASAAALGAELAPAAAPELTRTLYLQHCAACHGARRYGGTAPPLGPDALARKSDETLLATIRDGLPNTQMPAFGASVTPEQARALVRLLREPLPEMRWTLHDIAASRVAERGEPHPLPAGVRRENLTLVVERGRSSVSVLDGDTLRELDRFPARNLHGGIKFDRHWSSAFAVTRDGTALAYDLVRGVLRATAVVGVNTRNVAISPDGDFVAVANQLPAGLVLLDGELRPLAAFAFEGQPSGVYALPGGDRFALAMRDVPVLHLVRIPSLDLETVSLPEPFEDFIFVPGTQRIVASSRAGERLLLYDFGKREVLASLETQGLPHLFSACFFRRGGVLHAAFNHIGVPRLSIVAVEAFEIRQEIALRGSGYFARTHPATPYIWVDTNTETVQLVDKRSLALAEHSLTPAPGKKAMHVEFTAEGDKAFVSVWHPEGAVVVYDSSSLEELARLPYAMPVGKYNAASKTRLLE